MVRVTVALLRGKNIIEVSAEFIKKVETLLPVQPCKLGIHRKVAFDLHSSLQEFFGLLISLLDEERHMGKGQSRSFIILTRCALGDIGLKKYNK
ncbi:MULTISPECIES: hypothetical protein [Chitinophagaceae]